MTNLLNHLALGWWQWMWPMFWQTSLLIAVVAAADLLVRRWAWSQVRYALWLLVLVKLVLPPSLASPASVAGALWGRNAAARPVVAVAPAKPRTSLPVMPTDPTSLAERAAGTAGNAAATMIAPVAVPRTLLAWQVYPMAVWFAGVVVLGAWVTARFRGLRREYLRESRRSVAQSPSAVNPTTSQSPDSGAFTAEGDCATIHGAFPSQTPKTEVRTVAKAEESGPDGFAEALRGAAAQLRLRRLPAVVFSPRVQSPAVFGLWRPVLVMPAEAPGKEEAGEDARTTMPASLRHVLLHELAHIKRGDLHVLSFCILLQVLYWFHPLLWLVRRRLQHLRELCCDATVAGLLREETPHYRATLVEAARRLLAPPDTRDGLGLLGLIEQPGNLIERLRRLEGKVWRHARLRFVVVVLVVAAMCVAVVPMVQSQPKPAVVKKEAATKKDAVTMEGGATKKDTSPSAVSLLGERVLHFPEDRSLGTISIQLRQPDGTYLRPDGSSESRDLGEAQGTQRIPADAGVFLTVSSADALHTLAALPDITTGSLSFLDLPHAMTGEDFTPLERLPFVPSLWAMNAEVSDAALAHIGKMTALSSLQLFGAEGITATGMASLQQLRNLKSLNLSGATLTDDALAPIAEFPRLETLMLGHTGVSDAGLQAVGRVASLKTLWLNQTAVTEAGVRHLENLHQLEGLFLPHTQVGDEAIASLAKLTSLRNLEVNDTHLTTSGIAQLERALPNCEILSDREVARSRAEAEKRDRETALAGGKLSAGNLPLGSTLGKWEVTSGGDNCEADASNNTFRLSQGVRFRSEKLNLDGDTFTFYGNANRMVVTGTVDQPVRVSLEGMTATCQSFEFYLDEGKYVLTGSPVLKQVTGGPGGGVLETGGEKITILLREGSMRVLVDHPAPGSGGRAAGAAGSPTEKRIPLGSAPGGKSGTTPATFATGPIAEAQRPALQARVDAAKKNFERQKSLFEGGMASGADRDQAEMDYQVAVADAAGDRHAALQARAEGTRKIYENAKGMMAAGFTGLIELIEAEGNYKVAEAELAGDKVAVAQARLDAARKMVEYQEQAVTAGIAGTADVAEAKAKVAAAEAELLKARSEQPVGSALRLVLGDLNVTFEGTYEVEVDQDNKPVRVKATKNVRVRSDTLNLDCDTLTNDAQAKILTATGLADQPLRLALEDMTTTAQRLEFYPDEGKYVLTGNPVAQQVGPGGKVMETKGSKITLLLRDGKLRVMVDSEPGSVGHVGSSDGAPAEIRVPLAPTPPRRTPVGTPGGAKGPGASARDTTTTHGSATAGSDEQIVRRFAQEVKANREKITTWVGVADIRWVMFPGSSELSDRVGQAKFALDAGAEQLKIVYQCTQPPLMADGSHALREDVTTIRGKDECIVFETDPFREDEWGRERSVGLRPEGERSLAEIKRFLKREAIILPSANFGNECRAWDAGAFDPRSLFLVDSENPPEEYLMKFLLPLAFGMYQLEYTPPLLKLTQRFMNSSKVFVTVFDDSKGCNVVNSAWLGGPSAQSKEVEYARIAGIWVPSTAVSTLGGSTRKVVLRDQKLSVGIDKSEFSLDSVGLKPGEKVVDRVRGVSYSYGESPDAAKPLKDIGKKPGDSGTPATGRDGTDKQGAPGQAGSPTDVRVPPGSVPAAKANATPAAQPNATTATLVSGPDAASVRAK